MNENDAKLIVTCTHCARTCEVRPIKDGAPALAPGWLDLDGAKYCATCRTLNFCIRTVVLPVWSAEANDGESTKDSWSRFLSALCISFQQAAQVGTWAMRELAKADNGEVLRTKDAEGNIKIKLAKANETKDLYRKAREIGPDLDSQTVGAVLQRARKKYAETRWAQRALLTASLPKFAYPAPVPIPRRDASILFGNDNNLWLSVRLSGTRFNLRLARNQDHRRQLSAIQKGLAGIARLGQVTLTGRSDAGGKLSQIKARFSIELPIEKRDRTATLKVVTAKEVLWNVTIEGRAQPWNLNEDQIKSIVLGHKRRLLRLAEDSKFERRKAHHGIDLVRDRIARKYANRMRDFCHKAAGLLLGLAMRNHVGLIEYHETNERFIIEFPWSALRAAMMQKAAQNGIHVRLIEDSGQSAAA